MAEVSLVGTRMELRDMTTLTSEITKNEAAKVEAIKVENEPVPIAIVPMSPQIKEYLLKQFDTLRKEIEEFNLQMNTLGYHAALGTGVIWATLFTFSSEKKLAIPKIALSIPAILALAFAARNYNMQNHIHRASGHLAKLEEFFDIPKHLRWEESWRPIHQGESKGVANWLLVNWTHIYWMVLCLINITTPFILLWAK